MINEYFELGSCKTHEFGTAGRVSMKQDSPPILRQIRKSDINLNSDIHILPEESNAQRNSTLLRERALPDIPVSNDILPQHTRTASFEKTSERGISPERLSVHGKWKSNKPPAPQPPGNKKINTALAQGDHVSAENMPDAPRNSSFLNISEASSQESQSTLSKGDATFQNITSHEDVKLPQASASVEPDLSLVLKKCNMNSQPSCQGVVDDNSEAPLNNETNIRHYPNSVSVDLQESRPPRPLMFELPENNNETLPAASNEISYTTISVREPLSRMKEQINQRLPEVQTVQDSEDPYALVHEDEQTYAEIGGGSDSNTRPLSVTYSHTEPRELPPVPPTVESLKSVAYAHSRQASSASVSSYCAAISNSPENVSPQSHFCNAVPLYSTVDKYNKHRRTIHVSEGSYMPNGEESHNIEDLYAKVNKKSEISKSDLYLNNPKYDGSDERMEGITMKSSPSWRNFECPDLLCSSNGFSGSISTFVTNQQVCSQCQRHQEDPLCFHASPCEDKSTFDERQDLSTVKVHCHSEDPGYEKVMGSIHSDADSIELGYESVKKLNNSDSELTDPDYEAIRQSNNVDEYADPGYDVVKINDDQDPGYETVSKVAKHDNDITDPGYEKIRKVQRTESDATDPGYERLLRGRTVVNMRYNPSSRCESSASDPGYETVKNAEIKTNTRYKSVSRSVSDASDPGYETVKCKQTDEDNSKTESALKGLHFVPRGVFNTGNNGAELLNGYQHPCSSHSQNCDINIEPSLFKDLFEHSTGDNAALNGYTSQQKQ